MSMIETTARKSSLAIVNEAARHMPVDVHGLASKLGIRVVAKALTDQISGAIEHRNDGWVIIVNKNHSDNRQRFTVAHEIGHFVLHYRKLGNGTNDSKLYRADDRDGMYENWLDVEHEREANGFAAGILMPPQLVRRQYRAMQGLNDVPGRMAPLFGVSDAAMRYRIKELQDSGDL